MHEKGVLCRQLGTCGFLSGNHIHIVRCSRNHMTESQKQGSTSSSVVFIDGDWLYYAARRLKEEVDYSRLLSGLHNCFGPGTPIHLFCSVDTYKKEQRDFIGRLASLGYILHTSKLLRRKDRYGNVTLVSKGLDIALACSVMALSDDFQTLVLLTGDSDFVPLVTLTART